LADWGYRIGEVQDPVESPVRSLALVNVVMNINPTGFAEGPGLGAALGPDLPLLKEVFSQTGANSRVLEIDGDDMIVREHDCCCTEDDVVPVADSCDARDAASGDCELIEIPAAIHVFGDNSYPLLIDTIHRRLTARCGRK
jgi:hypothetical protein